MADVDRVVQACHVSGNYFMRHRRVWGSKMTDVENGFGTGGPRSIGGGVPADLA